jgi:transposase-like protein
VWKQSDGGVAFQAIKPARESGHGRSNTAMGIIAAKDRAPSRPEWAALEAWVRGKVQGLIQDLLEAEVTELLGRAKSERIAAVDGQAGYRNGHGKPRRVTLSCGTVKVRRPRVRGLEERFESRVLPLFKRRTKEVDELLPELYLHGLAEGDFDLAVRGLLGEDAPVSGSTVARLKEKWLAEQAEWSARRLDDLEVVYLWADGVYIKAGLEKDKAAILVVLAGLSNGRKVVLAIKSGHRESEQSWAGLLRDLRARGLRPPRLLIADGHLGVWSALRQVYPETEEQRCWNHRIVNVLDRIPKRLQEAAKSLLTRIPYAETAAEAERLRAAFGKWCEENGCGEASKVLEHDWRRMIAFYAFPKDHWIHLRTTNPVESPFAALRLRTDAAKRFKKVENATAVVWKLLLIAESTFRKLNAPELLKDVYHGAVYVDGAKPEELTKDTKETVKRKAAA